MHLQNYRPESTPSGLIPTFAFSVLLGLLALGPQACRCGPSTPGPDASTAPDSGGPGPDASTQPDAGADGGVCVGTIAASATETTPGGQVNLTLQNPVPGTLTFLNVNWSSAGGAVASTGAMTATWTAPAQPGTYVVTVTYLSTAVGATADGGATPCTDNITITVVGPDAGTDSGIVALDAGLDAGADAGLDAGTDAGAPDSGVPDSGSPPGPVTIVCSWGSFGCLACCDLTSTGLDCSAAVDCTGLLGSVVTKSFPGGPSFVLVGDFGGAGVAVYAVDTSVSPPALTPVFNIPGLTVLDLVEYGDPYVYAQAHLPDAGGVGAPNDLYQYGLATNGSLTALSPPFVTGMSQGQPVVDPATGHMYMTDFSDVGQCQVQDGGQVASLSPATVALPALANTSTAPPALASSISTLFVGTVQDYTDGGQQPMISQFTVQADGTLTPASTPTVNIPYQADHIAVAAPGGGAGPFVYVLGHDSAFVAHLNQYTVSGSTLVANSPASVSVCNPSFNMAVTPDQSLLLVACTSASQVAAYTIGANGNLTPTSWSPAPMTVAPGQLSVFTTQ